MKPNLDTLEVLPFSHTNKHTCIHTWGGTQQQWQNIKNGKRDQIKDFEIMILHLETPWFDAVVSQSPDIRQLSYPPSH